MIPSTSSIARIDIMQVREKGEIPQRYFDNYQLVVPTCDEMAVIHQKIKKYIDLSLDKAINSYEKYYKCFCAFQEDVQKLSEAFPQSITDKFTIENLNPFTVSYPLDKLNSLSFDDMKNIVTTRIKNVKVSYNKSKRKLFIKTEN